mgnify:CR=1 FL=1|tara:strand:+ start:89287 stop:91071 length:1785 start_codon:yes stop_codon:yes gene_type:complete
MKSTLYILLFLLCFSATAIAQDSLKNIYSKESLNKKAERVTQSLSANNPEATAQGYEDLAKGLIEKGDYARAETYLNSALEIYTTQKNKPKIASVTRLLAQVQEQQQKYTEAISNFEMAGESAVEPKASQLNRNDASRVSNRDNPRAQMDLIDSNIQILEETGDVEEAVTVYKQRAKVNLETDDTESALESYSRALEVAKDKPEEVIKLKSEISKVLAEDNKPANAIDVSLSALEEAKTLGDVEQQIKQRQTLAGLYLQTQNREEAIHQLEQAYTTAIENGRTVDAKTSTLALAALYQSGDELNASFEAYNRFLSDFDQLIQADSSLIDARIFEVTEERIRQLEESQTLKDSLLTKTNRYNTVLTVSVIGMFLLLALIAKALYSIRNRNKRIALQSLRREMNPHFIFNSLNSVNQFIAQNNELEANKYLTSYSNLMRSMMETSNEDFITLSDELEQLKKYLNLEHLRFQDTFEYEITVDEALDPDAVKVPNMLIQPHLENAIWHGLRYREGKGFLKLQFLKEENHIKVIVEDNGIGLDKSHELKTGNQKLHVSRGLNNVKERIQLLNDLYKQNIQFQIENRTDSPGTRVTLTFK